MMTVFPYGNNRKDPLFRQASQVFRIAAHPLRPHANKANTKKCYDTNTTEQIVNFFNEHEQPKVVLKVF